MSSFDDLKKSLQDNQSERLAKEQKERSDKPRHTVYQGNRTIQQLGDQPIDNSVVINNQSLAIGDVMLPLAKGNVLRRVDNTNGGALLGSAYRDAVENDFDANGRRRGGAGDGLGRNGGLEPSDPSSTNRPRRRPSRFPPPFGCTPPPATCFWSNDPVAPSGYQGYGSAVVNENGVPLYLYCVAGTSVAANLNCSFLDTAIRYRCEGGVCVPDPSGVYASLAQCQAALISANFTGGQCTGFEYQIGYTYTQFDLSSVQIFQIVVPAVGSALTVFGAISVISTNPQPTSPVERGVRAVGFDSVGTPTTRRINHGFQSANLTDTITAITVLRVDGMPDNCGNPSPSCPI